MAKTSKRARKTSPLYLPSAFDLFTPSKELVLKHIWIFGPLYAVPLILGIHDWIWSPSGPQDHGGWYQHAYGFSASPGNPFPDYGFSGIIGFSIIWFLFVLVAGTIAAIMSQAAQLNAAQGHRLDFHDLWEVVKKMGWRLLGLYIATVVIVLVGLILLIVPGLIFLRRYYLAPYAMIDKNLSIGEALNKSAELSKLNTGAVWGLFGVMLLIGLIGIVPFIGGLVSFVVGSLYSVAPAMRYEQLKKLA
jgi:hypothetical protein